MASVPVETLIKEAGGTLAPTSTMQEATTLKPGLMTTEQVASLSALTPQLASGALTASTTTLTPTYWRTCCEYTVAAGVSGVLQFANPGSVAGYEACVSVTFSAGSRVTIKNAAGTTLVQDYAGTARTYNYRFYFNGSAWVDRTPYFARWKRILDIDFAAQTSQTFTTDGSYTVGGQTFVVANCANLFASYTATFGVINGTGLRIPAQAAALTNWSTAELAGSFPGVMWDGLTAQPNNRRVRFAVLTGASSADTGCHHYLGLRARPSVSAVLGRYVSRGVNASGLAVTGTSGWYVHNGSLVFTQTGKGGYSPTSASGLGLDTLREFSHGEFPFAQITGAGVNSLDWYIPLGVNYTSNGITTESVSGSMLSNYVLSMQGFLTTPGANGYITVRRVVAEYLEIGGS